MDSDGPSSPIAMPSSPPPSVPVATASTSNGTPRRPFTDALAMGDREAGEENQTGRDRRRRRPRQVNGDVLMVKDAVGESVAESFETFLKT